VNTQSTQGAPSSDAPSSRDKAAEAGKESQAAESAGAAFHDAAKRIAEVKEYILYYVAVQADAAKLAVRNAAIYAVLGIVALLAAGAAVVIAVALLLVGIARGIGEWLHHPWLGDLIVGIVILAAIALGAKIALSGMTRSFRKNTVKKYESLQRQQRSRFGHDVEERGGK
jgi:hypothetical protein